MTEVHRAPAFEQTVEQVAQRIERFGWPYKQHSRAVVRVVLREVDLERLRKLVEPKEWLGWEQVDSIYDEARLLRKERDEARAEVKKLRARLRSQSGQGASDDR